MVRGSLLRAASLLIAAMQAEGVEASKPKAEAIIPGNTDPSDNANLHNAFFDKFDVNRDDFISRDEVAQVLPSMIASVDADHEKSGSPEEKVDGFMIVLDEDSDGVGSRAEMANFIKKMHDMDGHTNRLPSGTPGATQRQAQEQAPEDNEAESTHWRWSDHDEL